MSPTVEKHSTTSWPTVTELQPEKRHGFPRNIGPIADLDIDLSLTPKKYEILGTHPDSQILFTDVNILDSTGNEPYRGDVLIRGMQSVLGHNAYLS